MIARRVHYAYHSFVAAVVASPTLCGWTAADREVVGIGTHNVSLYLYVYARDDDRGNHHSSMHRPCCRAFDRSPGEHNNNKNKNNVAG